MTNRTDTRKLALLDKYINQYENTHWEELEMKMKQIEDELHYRFENENPSTIHDFDHLEHLFFELMAINMLNELTKREGKEYAKDC